MRDDWNMAEEGSGASVEPCRLRLICPKGLLSSSACIGVSGKDGGGQRGGQQHVGHHSAEYIPDPFSLICVEELAQQKSPERSHRSRASCSTGGRST